MFVVAPASSLRNGSAFALLSSNSALLAAATALAAKVGPGSPTGSSASTLVLGGGDDTPDEVVLVPLAENVSRYYSGTHSMAITAGLASAGISTSGGSVLIVLAQEAHLVPAAMAVARACPTYSRKTSGGNATSPPPVVVGFASATDPGVLLDESKALSAAELITDSIRQAADIAETPAEDASTADVEARARAVLEGVPGVDITTIAGDDLRAAGLEGIYNVGRAAVVPPRLVILRYTPAEAAQAATPAIGLVGKGIVYDTGGLNLKRSGGRHMKGDMAGAASVLGAFSFWAKFSSEHPESAFPAPLVAALCLAENSIGPTAYRPDDILTMHSGLTCEVHNTDAEGRFVVGDVSGLRCACTVLPLRFCCVKSIVTQFANWLPTLHRRAVRTLHVNLASGPSSTLPRSLVIPPSRALRTAPS